MIIYCPCKRHHTHKQRSSNRYTLTRSVDVGRRHLGCCFLPSPLTVAATATVFLADTEGGTGLGRIGIPDERAVLGLCGLVAVATPDDLRLVAMSLANTMAAATGVPDVECSEALRLVREVTAAPSSATVGAAPFNISPTTLGGPTDLWPCNAPGGIVNIIFCETRKDDGGNAREPSANRMLLFLTPRDYRYERHNNIKNNKILYDTFYTHVCTHLGLLWALRWRELHINCKTLMLARQRSLLLFERGAQYTGGAAVVYNIIIGVAYRLVFRLARACCCTDVVNGTRDCGGSGQESPLLDDDNTRILMKG